MSSPQAGWYQDPQNPQGLRYWDGTQWTSQTHQPTPPPAPVLGGYQAPPQAPGVPAYQGYSPTQQGSYAAAPVSFPEAAKGLVTKWSFRGRASRSEYWFAALTLFLFAFTTRTVSGLVGVDAIGYLFALIEFVGWVNLLLFAIRRYHDTGRSGLWLLPQIILNMVLGIATYVMLLVLVFAAAFGSATDAKSLGIAGLVVGVLFVAVSVWITVWLSLPGKPEQNRFDN